MTLVGKDATVVDKGIVETGRPRLRRPKGSARIDGITVVGFRVPVLTNSRFKLVMERLGMSSSQVISQFMMDT